MKKFFTEKNFSLLHVILIIVLGSLLKTATNIAVEGFNKPIPTYAKEVK